MLEYLEACLEPADGSPQDRQRTLSETLGTRQSDGRAAKCDAVFVNKWIDYSHKYGLGYQLTNGSIGVFFNDSTTIILAGDQQ